MKILFVCLGNICRSPAADGVMVHKVKELNLEDKFTIDSAGTSAYHAGEPADKRMQEHAYRRGYLLTSTARGFRKSDFEDFDLILAMDESNYENILKLNPNSEQRKNLALFCDYCTGEFSSYKEVPDPYYGGERGFEEVLDLVENGVEEILKRHGN